MKIVFFILLSITIMTVDHRQGHLKILRSGLSTLVYPIQIAVNLPIEGWRWATESFVSHESLLEENSNLRRELNLLNSRLQRFIILEEENNRLRQLLGSSVRIKEKVLIAELLAVELETNRHLIEINKGTRNKVYDGQPVVDAKGIIGQIIHVGPFSSNVLLITDSSHSLPVQVNRNGLRAIAVGTGQTNTLQLEHLPTNADINRGDLIVSSGLGKRFPRGYPVGTVEEIIIEPGDAFAKVSVQPSADLTKNREVLLVWPFDNNTEPTKN